MKKFMCIFLVLCMMICVTTIPYPEWIIRDMKRCGYKIKNVDGIEARLLAKEASSVMKEE